MNYDYFHELTFRRRHLPNQLRHGMNVRTVLREIGNLLIVSIFGSLCSLDESIKPAIQFVTSDPNSFDEIDTMISEIEETPCICCHWRDGYEVELYCLVDVVKNYTICMRLSVADN